MRRRLYASYFHFAIKNFKKPQKSSGNSITTNGGGGGSMREDDIIKDDVINKELPSHKVESFEQIKLNK